MIKSITIVLFSFIALLSFGQNTQNGHFLVEFEKFSPPIQDVIRSFEGHIAEPFMANDVSGVEHFLGNYKGKKVILWFWSIHNELAKSQIGPMTLLQQTHDDLKVIAFAKEPKAEVLDYLRQFPIDGLDVIPNGEIFGQMAYGADLGSPRMFLIDDFGIIKAVIPEIAFVDSSKLLISLESILGGM